MRHLTWMNLAYLPYEVYAQRIPIAYHVSEEGECQQYE